MKAPPPRERQFARLLCSNADDHASGILTASRGRLRRLFCLQDGWIVYAASNLIEEQFLEYLVRIDAISESMRSEVVEESTRASVKPIAYLMQRGRATKDALRRSMEGLVREMFTSTLEWPDGHSTFDDGVPALDGEVTVRLAPRSMVLAHSKRYPASVDALRVRIGPPDLRPVASPLASAEGAQADPLGAFLLERCDGTIALTEIVKESPAGEEATLRAIYGFLLAGLLEPEDREARRQKEALLKDDRLTREECLGRLAMVAGQDHYGVLGVDRTARLKLIREAYYALARRYHPDRFRSGPLSDLLARFEEFFTLVTSAYNTLFDPERRAEYDEQLNAAKKGDASKDTDTGYLARQNFLRARALAAQRKFTEAVTFLENAISLDPRQADYHLELGLVLSRNPRHREEAERHLLETIELSPTTVGAYVALGRMYLKGGRAEHAGQMAREALRWEPGHLEASELLAEAGDAPDETS
jgi:tetratricopeptide (TPR) repeat protein